MLAYGQNNQAVTADNATAHRKIFRTHAVSLYSSKFAEVVDLPVYLLLTVQMLRCTQMLIQKFCQPAALGNARFRLKLLKLQLRVSQ